MNHLMATFDVGCPNVDLDKDRAYSINRILGTLGSVYHIDVPSAAYLMRTDFMSLG